MLFCVAIVYTRHRLPLIEYSQALGVAGNTNGCVVGPSDRSFMADSGWRALQSDDVYKKRAAAVSFPS